MNRKPNPIIAVGAVLLLAGVAVLAVLAGRGSSSHPSTVKALVASADVAAGTPVAAAALQVRDVSARDVPAGSPASIGAIAGTFAATKILKGQVISGTSFGQVAATTPGAGLALPRGKEAVGVELGFAPGGLRYVVPGNHINVYVAPKAKPAADGTLRVSPGQLLVPDLLVLRTTPGAGDGSGTAVTPGAGNLDFLLAVTPPQARTLVGAASNAEAGVLYFTLSSTTAS